MYVNFAGHINGEQVLVTVDSFSKWPEVHYMKFVSTKGTVEKSR